MSGFNCNDKNLDSRYFQEAWVPSVTICDQDLFPFIENLPVVTGLATVSAGLNVKITWDLNTKYKKSVEYKVNSGSWIVLGTFDYNESYAEIDGYTLTLSLGDIVQVKARHYQELNDKTIYSYYSDVVNVTLSQFKIFTGSLTGDLQEITRTGTATWSISENFILVDNPRNVFTINVLGVNLVGSWDLSECLNLETFTSINTVLASVNARNCVNLNYIEVSHSQLQSIDVSGCVFLNSLFAINNSLTHLDISGTSINLLMVNGNPDLEYVVANGVDGNNGKSIINVESCNLSAQALNVLMSSLGVNNAGKGSLLIENNLGSLNANTSIATAKGWTVSGGPNKIFSGSSRPNIQAFIEGEEHTGNYVTFSTYGTNSIYADNFLNITALDLTNQDVQGELYLSNSNMTSINIQDTDVTYLQCFQSSDLETINISRCTLLQQIDASSCASLSSLILENTDLASIDIRNCNFSNTNLNTLFSQLPPTTGGVIAVTYNILSDLFLQTIKEPSVQAYPFETNSIDMLAQGFETLGILTVSIASANFAGRFQESNDDSTWSDIVGGAFALVTVPVNLTILFTRTKRYIRFVGEFPGDNFDVLLHVAIAANTITSAVTLSDLSVYFGTTPAVLSANFQGDTLDMGSLSGGILILQSVADISAGGSVTSIYEKSDDGSTWTTLDSFPIVTFSSNVILSLDLNSRYIRYAGELAGSEVEVILSSIVISLPGAETFMPSIATTKGWDVLS